METYIKPSLTCISISRKKFRTVCEAIQTEKIRTTWWERGAYPWNPTECYAGL